MAKSCRELTWTSVLLGVVVGAVLNTGICYAGLQIGFTIVGSTVAAVSRPWWSVTRSAAR